jgi:hypothetical protein
MTNETWKLQLREKKAESFLIKMETIQDFSENHSLLHFENHQQSGIEHETMN